MHSSWDNFQLEWILYTNSSHSLERFFRNTKVFFYGIIPMSPFCLHLWFELDEAQHNPPGDRVRHHLAAIKQKLIDIPRRARYLCVWVFVGLDFRGDQMSPRTCSLQNKKVTFQLYLKMVMVPFFQMNVLKKGIGSLHETEILHIPLERS